MPNTKSKVSQKKIADKKPRKIAKTEEQTALIKRERSPRTKTAVEHSCKDSNPMIEVLVDKPDYAEIDLLMNVKEPATSLEVIDIIDLDRPFKKTSMPSDEDFAMLTKSLTDSALEQSNKIVYGNTLSDSKISSRMLGRHAIEITVASTTPQSFGSWIKQFDRYYLFYRWSQNGMTLPWWFKYTKASRTAKFKFNMDYRDINEIGKLAASLLPANFYVKVVEAKLDRVSVVDNYVPYVKSKTSWRTKLQAKKKAFYKRLAQKLLAKAC